MIYKIHFFFTYDICVLYKKPNFDDHWKSKNIECNVGKMKQRSPTDDNLRWVSYKELSKSKTFVGKLCRYLHNIMFKTRRS